MCVPGGAPDWKLELQEARASIPRALRIEDGPLASLVGGVAPLEGGQQPSTISGGALAADLRSVVDALVGSGAGGLAPSGMTGSFQDRKPPAHVVGSEAIPEK